MKKILFLICAVSYTIFFSQKKNDLSDLKVRYYMIMASDSTLLKNENETSVFSYTLLCNTGRSIYADETAKAFYDYLKNNRGNYGQLPISSYPKSKSSTYKDGDKIIVTLPIGRKDLYRYEEPNLKWELIKDKQKTILSYPCKLAKVISDTGKVYYAWYTSSIPIPEGPFRFKGLDGLILEVYNEEKTIKIDAVEIVKAKELIEPLKYASVYDVNKSQFLKKRKEYVIDPNADNYESKYKAIGPDGKEIKIERQESIKIKENNLLD
ncbi:GLPGLI family protein [Chryseobacterium daecheongense]|uniref:GLPGLI family protein n=1 Tax=Chryseobacterium daecheongense TaxID=192389 RepID=UPI001FD71A00|nr:GLPGLI family protein [Chryseobacterium daecheongense]UOU97832.1 GLPGLI family protein [Chryseobacterium daecheongense]